MFLVISLGLKLPGLRRDLYYHATSTTAEAKRMPGRLNSLRISEMLICLVIGVARRFPKKLLQDFEASPFVQGKTSATR